MKNRQSFFVLVVFAVLMPALLLATTSRKTELECPVCGNRLEARLIMSTNNFGGVDSDFLQRPRGSSPVMVRPVTCIKCNYSGYLDDFAEEVKAKLPATFTKAITEDKALKPMLELASFPVQAAVPAWVKYDLIAQTRKLEGSPAADVAHQYLSASWAIRMQGEIPLSQELLQAGFDYATEKFADRMKNREVNPATLNVEIALEVLQAVEKAPDKEKLAALTFACVILRRYGENPHALEALAQLEPMLEKDTAASIIKTSKESIESEQSFQKLALDQFNLAFAEATDEELQARFAYLIGELNRRLGNYSEARDWFKKVRAFNKRPEFLNEFMEEVEKRMPPTK